MRNVRTLLFAKRAQTNPSYSKEIHHGYNKVLVQSLCNCRRAVPRRHNSPAEFAAEPYYTNPRESISAAGAGVRIQLGPHAYGIAAMIDLHDAWVPNALANIQDGTFVKACVLENPGREAAAKAQEQLQSKSKKKRKRKSEEVLAPQHYI